MRPVDHNQFACPVKYCPWRMAEGKRCPDHHEKAIPNPNYGHTDERRTLVKS